MTGNPDLAALAGSLDIYAPHVLRATCVPGLVVAVATRDGATLEVAYGAADLAAERSMTPDAVFPVGSLSKLVVATAVMQMVESGEIGLDYDVRHLVGFRLHAPAPFTVRDLMTHSSGLRTDTYYASLSPQRDDLGTFLTDLFARGQAHEYPGTPPGLLWVDSPGRYRYSSLGIALLAHIVEVRACMPFGEWAASEILGPLGMTSSAMPDPRTQAPESLTRRRTVGYARWGNQCVPTPTLHTAVPPSTGLLTTCGDYARLLIALLNGGTFEHSEVLTHGSVMEMTKLQQTGAFPGEDAHSVGLVLDLVRPGTPQHFLGHSGAYPFGWWADARAYPQLGLVVVAAQNSWDMSRYVNPPARAATGLICDYVANRPAGERDATAAPLPYQAAYAHGLVIADRITGLLGAGRLEEEHIRAMIAGARPVAQAAYSGWDAQGFADAITAARDVAASGESMRALLDARNAAVSPGDLRLLALEAGASRAELAVPLGHFADRLDDPAPPPDAAEATPAVARREG